MSECNIVSISGGKDSTALALLALEVKPSNLRFVFADTGHEHSQTYEYLDYLETKIGTITRVKANFDNQIARKREVVKTKWRSEGVPEARVQDALSVLHPTGNPFLDLCLWKGRFPSTRARFCSFELKHNAIDQIVNPMLDKHDDVISWQGVRADESRARANLPEREEVADRPGLINYRPILNWTAAEVFAFHAKYDVKPNPLYTQGMGRVGCMPCIHYRKLELQEIALRFPKEISKVEEWERLVSKASKRGSSTFMFAMTDPTVSASDDISADTHGILRMVKWSKTARGGRQFDMLTALNDGKSCSSVYGLCE